MSREIEIPTIDVSALFAGTPGARERTDRAIMAAAAAFGFFAAGGFPIELAIGPECRGALLRIFDLPDGEIRRLWRQRFDPSHGNVYRGWFPLQRGFLTSKEGIDMGADLAHGFCVVRDDDPLREATPLPPEHALPGWRATAAAYYRGMEFVGRALMRSIARGLGLEEHYFDATFERGLSTLRVIRYPPRTDIEDAAASPGFWVEHRGTRRHITGAPHVDSGFLTLLAQDGVAGLQTRHVSGEWLDVPPAGNLLAVNFGGLLERWSGGRIKATLHRVVGEGVERKSIPFFYEARADAEIRPLPSEPPDSFEPFFYGDYLWRATTKFVEFAGMDSLRKPLRP